MKVVDLTVADVNATELKRKLDFEQKYLLLDVDSEVYSLEVSDITDTAIYLKPVDDELRVCPKCNSKMDKVETKDEIFFVCECCEYTERY